MSNAFKKKKQQSNIEDLSSKLNFLLGSQILSNNQHESMQLQRSLILKSAMFWDSKSRIQRIKSLMLSNLNLEQFDDVDDFKIRQLTSIRQLSLSKNKIIHLQPLSILDTLVTLNINHNKVYNLSPLQALQNLEELYASNNQIVNIDPLKKLSNIRILNVYKNKISKFEDTYATLQKLTKLEDLDVQQNPFYSQQIKKELIALSITRLNDQLIPKSEKDTSMSASIINMSSSCVINPLNMSMMRDTKSSFFNPSSKSIKRNKIKDLQSKLEALQDDYAKIDDEFEEQIVKNVQLKTQWHQISQRVKKSNEQKQDNEYKAQQIKLLKRKAKDLKENLFTKTKKGQLLRRLFELQTQGAVKKVQKKQTKKHVVWNRKFDSDDVIIVADDNKYLQEDEELAELLASNSNTLQELRKQLQSMY